MGANFLAPQFWDSPSVVALGKCGKLLFASLVSGPQLGKVPGLYRAFPAAFHHPMLPWEPPEVEDAFKRILDAGMAEYDPEARLIRLPKIWKYHLPQNPKQILSWRTNWVDLPNVALKFAHLDSLRRLAYRSAKSGPEAFDKYFSGIVYGEPETYPLDRSTLWPAAAAPKPPVSQPRPDAGDPTGSVDPQRDRNFSMSRDPAESKEDPDQDLDLDPDLDLDQRYRKATDRVSKGSGYGSDSLSVEEESPPTAVGVPDVRRARIAPVADLRPDNRPASQPASAPSSRTGSLPGGASGGGRGAEVVPLAATVGYGARFRHD